jgi:hypothetical protein
MNVSARCQRSGIEIRVGIEPKHAQFLDRFPAVLRHGADRADRERVVPTQENREAPGCELAIDGSIDQPIPGGDLWQVAVAA